ncbi:hypothetical protein GCM10007094_02210 [Pseudovibrio japonicus]|uniref:Uncharacterized protein n=1 Tax=Pseudovibrio japonicus TaxID=366534 RepID=A0ABQ3DW05_9HYPH|nr:hypothetical protein [Pseudovibrio japonicus]GHB18058.1 hypothetical protein GCM10007094_02210 [Pseudovibrio japonicus]
MRSLRHLALMLASLTTMLTPAVANKALGIPRLTEVTGRAEVIDKRQLNIYHPHGIARVGLMWPAESHYSLRRQLATAVKVKCLMFGSDTAASCVAIDQFGTRWLLGNVKQAAFTK